MPIVDLQGFAFVCVLQPGPQAIDHNGHVNVAHYGLFYEEATDIWHPQFGMSMEYKAKENATFFASESHMKYVREVPPDGKMAIHARVDDLSQKAMVSIMLMADPATGELISAQEQLWLHVDLATRRVVPMRADVARPLAELVASQPPLGAPLPFKRTIEFRR